MRHATTRWVLGAMVCAATAGLGAQSVAEWQDVMRNLRHPQVDTRLDALARVERARYVPAAEPVSALLVDPDDRVQLAALDAELTFFLADDVGRGSSLFSLGDSKSRAQLAFEAGRLARAAVPAPPAIFDRLVMAMRDENPRVRFDAVHTLGLVAEEPITGAQAVALAAELDHYDPIIRAATARVLGRLRATAALPALRVAVDDTNALVRVYAVEALGLMRDEQVVGPARGFLARGRGDLARASLLALARVGAREDIELFRERLVDRDAPMRRAAVEGIARSGDRESLATVERLATSDPSALVRLAAQYALHLSGQQVTTHLLAAAAADGGLAPQAVEYLLALGHPAVPGITEALKVATDSRHRAVLAALIGYLGTDAERPLLEPLAQDRDARVRRAAANGLERIQRGL